MKYKFLHIDDLSFSDSFKRGLLKINSLSRFDKIMIYFWLLGPFIYLIERDPADLWLTTISLTFLYRSYIRSDWNGQNSCGLNYYYFGFYHSFLHCLVILYIQFLKASLDRFIILQLLKFGWVRIEI